MSRMPNTYRPPTGGPLRWEDDATGELQGAVAAFLEHGMKPRVHLSAEDIELVRDYCQYYINAPCWHTGKPGSQDAQTFERLRESIKHANTFEKLDAWMNEALTVGIDPL